MDAVSDRDFCIEYAFCLSSIAMHMSRLCEEWIIWCNDEVKFIEISDAYCTGSSIMPQKKNPDVLELIRGKSGRVFGHLTSLLTLLKGLPLSYNRDMQEDKVAIFDASDTVQGSLSILAELVANTSFNGERMMQACDKGFKAFSSVIEKDVYKALGVENCIKNYKSHGSTAPQFVKKRIAYWEKKLINSLPRKNTD